MPNNKKQVYRVIVKLLSFLGLSLFAFFIIRSALLPPLPQVMQETLATKVDLSNLLQGQIRVVQWDHQNIAVLHRPDIMQKTLSNDVTTMDKSYFIFINKGGDLNCPLVLDHSQIYLKDSCSGYLYDAKGKLFKLNPRLNDLIIPPYHFINQNHLLIGKN
jgi:hypothetical protein